MSESEYPSTGIGVDTVVGLYKEANARLKEIKVKMPIAKTNEEVVELGQLVYQALGVSIHAACLAHILNEGGNPVLDALYHSEKNALIGRHIVGNKQGVMTLLFLENSGKAELVIAGIADGMKGPKSTKIISDHADIGTAYETITGNKLDMSNITVATYSEG